MLKKLAIVFGVLAVVSVVLMAALPSIINIDQHRPEIVRAINQNINGTASIDKLSLSLWGKVEVEVNGLTIKNTKGQQLVGVGKTYVLLPFHTLLFGPQLTVQLKNPDLYVQRFANGKINLLSLVKEAKADPNAPKEDPVTPDPSKTDKKPTETAEDGKPVELPGYILAIVYGATFNFELLESNIKFVDDGMAFSQELKDFNITLHDVSLSKEMHLKVWSGIKTKLVGVLDVEGPMVIEAFIKPKMNGLEFENAAVKLTVNFDGIDVNVPETFRKKPGVPTNIVLNTVVSPKNVDVSKFQINFHNMSLDAAAKLTGLDQPAPALFFNLDSNKIDLSTWKSLVEPLGALGMKGHMVLSAGAKGKLTDINYAAALDVLDLSLDLPVFKDKPVINVEVRVVTNELQKAEVRVNGKGTDLKVLANIKDFAQPNISVDVAGKSVDLDSMLGIADEIEKAKKEAVKSDPKAEAKAAEEAKLAEANAKKAGGGKGGAGKGSAEEPVEDIDGGLAELRENEFLKGMRAAVKVRIGNFRAANVDVSNIKTDIHYANLAAAVDQISLAVFKGTFFTSMKVDLKPAMPTYGLKLDVNKIDIAAAVESNMDFLANTLLGQISFKAMGKGQSFNSDKLLKNLNLNGNFNVVNATFASVDVTKMASEGVNGSIDSLKKKYPAIKVKGVGGMGDKKSTYEYVGSDFTMLNGVFKAPNFHAKAKPNNGIDIKGYTELGLIEDQMKAKWNVVDTYNWTKLADVSISSKGVKVDRLFAEGADPVRFPVSVGCKLSEPCYDTAEAAKHLGKVAANNIKGAVSGRLNAELDKQKALARKKFNKKKAAAKARLNKKRDAARKKIAAKKAAAKKRAAAARKKEEDKAKNKAKGKAKDKLKNKFGL